MSVVGDQFGLSPKPKKKAAPKKAAPKKKAAAKKKK